MNGKALLVAVLLLLVVGATFLVVASTAAREDDRPISREIRVGARDYRFNETNPALVFHPGERVRILFVNDEPLDSSVEHNFKVVGLNARCSRALKPGESEAVIVDVPESGEYRYTCCAHPGMGGKVVLETPKADPAPVASAK
jgi:plastocyanin